jgi:Flp pilus assembly pilin Flp
MRNLIKNLVSDESGQDLAEYAIALAVIAVGVGAVVVGLGTDVMGVWTAARARVQSAT